MTSTQQLKPKYSCCCFFSQITSDGKNFACHCLTKNKHITKEGHKSRAKVALCDVAFRIKALALNQDEKHSGGMYGDSVSTILNDNNETDDNVKLNLKDIYPSKNKISAQNLKILWEKNRLCLQKF